MFVRVTEVPCTALILVHANTTLLTQVRLEVYGKESDGRGGAGLACGCEPRLCDAAGGAVSRGGTQGEEDTRLCKGTGLQVGVVVVVVVVSVVANSGVLYLCAINIKTLFIISKRDRGKKKSERNKKKRK